MVEVDSEDERTLYCGNLHEMVTEELLYELFLQVAPVQRVNIPMDRQGNQCRFGFVVLKHQVSVDYALQLFEGISLFDQTLNIRVRNGGKPQQQQHQRQYGQPQQLHSRHQQPVEQDPEEMLQQVRALMAMGVHLNSPAYLPAMTMQQVPYQLPQQSHYQQQQQQQHNTPPNWAQNDVGRHGQDFDDRQSHGRHNRGQQDHKNRNQRGGHSDQRSYGGPDRGHYHNSDRKRDRGDRRPYSDDRSSYGQRGSRFTR